jgi:large subunit ribosomal protein L29
MRPSELRELDDDELGLQLETARKELLNLRFQLATGQLDNVSRIPQVRKDIARVLTEMRSRELAAYESQAGYGADGTQRVQGAQGTEASARASEETEGLADTEDSSTGEDDSLEDSEGSQASASEVESIAVGEEE